MCVRAVVGGGVRRCGTCLGVLGEGLAYFGGLGVWGGEFGACGGSFGWGSASEQKNSPFQILSSSSSVNW